jgi:hypothetical protein
MALLPLSALLAQCWGTDGDERERHARCLGRAPLQESVWHGDTCAVRVDVLAMSYQPHFDNDPQGGAAPGGYYPPPATGGGYYGGDVAPPPGPSSQYGYGSPVVGYGVPVAYPGAAAPQILPAATPYGSGGLEASGLQSGACRGGLSASGRPAASSVPARTWLWPAQCQRISLLRPASVAP